VCINKRSFIFVGNDELLFTCNSTKVYERSGRLSGGCCGGLWRVCGGCRGCVPWISLDAGAGSLVYMRPCKAKSEVVT
jgi:hypothetical protein